MWSFRKLITEKNPFYKTKAILFLSHYTRLSVLFLPLDYSRLAFTFRKIKSISNHTNSTSPYFAFSKKEYAYKNGILYLNLLWWLRSYLCSPICHCSVLKNFTPYPANLSCTFCIIKSFSIHVIHFTASISAFSNRSPFKNSVGSRKLLSESGSHWHWST